MLRVSQSSAEAAKRDSKSTPAEGPSDAAKAAPAVIPEETESERQERAWAEAEAVSVSQRSCSHTLALPSEPVNTSPHLFKCALLKVMVFTFEAVCCI